MTGQIPSQSSFSLQLRDRIEYPEGGVLSKVIHKDDKCDHTLFCLAADTSISEHTSPRNATINVIEGKGIFTLEGKEIPLEPGVFISMQANAPHALKAVLRERLDTIERLVETKGILSIAELETYQPDEKADQEREKWRAEYIARILRTITDDT